METKKVRRKKMDSHTDLSETRYLMIDEVWGVNIPARFYENFEFKEWGLNHDDYVNLADQYQENYWEAWEDLLVKATHVDEHGKIWQLEESEGLWAVREDHDSEEDC